MPKKKSHNQEGDVVLIHYEDQPVVYARIEAIEPDVKRSWYRVTLLILTIPAQVVTWILREEYINGATFTMGGKVIKFEKVDRVAVKQTPGDDGAPSEPRNSVKPSKVIAFKKQH
jgi:hypothetical protein